MGRVFDTPLPITLPAFPEGEAEAIVSLQKAGAETIHIRKPGASSTELEAFLSRLVRAGADMSRLTLHYDESLARRYGLGGVHLHGEELSRSAGRDLRRSCSVHSWAEARRFVSCSDYLFISPLFDSISKPGYRSGIDIGCAGSELSALPEGGTVVALGGITPANIARVRMAGFGGAAVLGALWAERYGRVDAEGTLCNYFRLTRGWRAAGGTLQFISDGDLVVAEKFLAGGGRWIQLRMKEAAAAEIAERGGRMLELCRKYGAVLLLNDNPALAAEVGADGVHLGRTDMAPGEARAIVGEAAIIGSTANTIGAIEEIAQGPTDYIGLGPFRYTTTKKNLSPILGLEGYRSVMGRMREEGIWLPVVAIGGIELGDTARIMASGVTGIALSGALSRAVDTKEKTIEFLKQIR